MAKKKIDNSKKKEAKEEKPKKKYTLTLTDSKIKKLLDFSHLEELFYLLNLLDEKQIESFLTHYKNSEIDHTKDAKLERVLKSSGKAHDLIENVKTEISKSLQDEYIKIREEISSLRKMGSDLYIEDIKSLSIPSKINMFKGTGNKNDFYKIKKTIHELRTEVENALKIAEEEKRKKEIEKDKKSQEKKKIDKKAEQLDKKEEKPVKKATKQEDKK